MRTSRHDQAFRRQSRRQPYITASGGTTRPFTGTVSGPDGTAPLSSGSAERIWGWDYSRAPTAEVNGEPLQMIERDRLDLVAARRRTEEAPRLV
jgi:hypothetical protein